MTRITSTVLIFLLLLNGTIGIMSASGLSEDIGIDLAPGVDDAMDSVISNARDGFTASEGLGDTLFSLFAAAMSTFNVLIQGVFAAPQMFINVGFPSWIVVPFFVPMYVVATLELVYAASGRSLI